MIEALGGVESIFGTKTSSFFVKFTVVLAVLFFVTSLSLTYLSRIRSSSLLEKVSEEPPLEKKVFPKKTNVSSDSSSAQPIEKPSVDGQSQR